MCRAHDGRLVVARASVAIPDIALATNDRDSGAPLIYFNPYVILWLPQQLREWIYAHECAHHVLDHLRYGFVTAQQEIEADCWATRELTAQGVLAPADIDLMEHAIAAAAAGPLDAHAGPVSRDRTAEMRALSGRHRAVRALPAVSVLTRRQPGKRRPDAASGVRLAAERDEACCIEPATPTPPAALEAARRATASAGGAPHCGCGS
ncbi:MAG: hypothetical protein MZW92_20130 [Comamonadaceae bacterium]|nr:hypothetical protein [Comamonadaceae bacterium]